MKLGKHFDVYIAAVVVLFLSSFSLSYYWLYQNKKSTESIFQAYGLTQENGSKSAGTLEKIKLLTDLSLKNQQTHMVMGLIGSIVLLFLAVSLGILAKRAVMLPMKRALESLTMSTHQVKYASNQQAEGIEQVNKAVIHLEKVVQGNVVNAEESSAIAEVLHNQAGHLKNAVDQLSSLARVYKATPEELVKVVRAAAEFLSKKGDAGLPEFRNKQGRWVWKDAYIFVHNHQNGLVVAHPMKPSDEGTPFMAVKDYRGTAFFVRGSEVAKNHRGGWIEYWWPKPGKKKPSRKVTYIMRVPNTPYQLGAGAYDDKLSITDLEQLLR
ncbi:MAG: hypothetical protein EHM45_22255 [Desulfobacteraceae bacterium]|nr:MAG: hypothetical protein EHM45_22255 [Desulfobacteraceae bacterium]